MPEKRQNPLERWASKPYRSRTTKLMLALCIAAAGCIMWSQLWPMDNDSYYMIPQGNSILENGIPRLNEFVYHKGAGIVVQQWLYCILMALADRVPDNMGLMLLMVVQALAVFWITERFLKKSTRDPFWSCLAAAVVTMVSCPGYTFTMRPENVTIFLMFLQCMALDAWRETGKKRYLVSLLPIMLAEANLHISMWPAHLCVYLAYLVPAAFPWLQEKLKLKRWFKDGLCPGLMEADGLKPNAALYGTIVLSILTILINPYGLKGALYLFHSMPVFSLIAIKEQAPPALVSELAVVNIAIFILLWLMVKHRLAKATEICIVLGFTFLACLNYHNTIFRPIAMAFLAKPLLRLLESKNPALAKDIVPNGVKILPWLGTVISVLAICMVVIPSMPEYKSRPDLDPAIAYIKANQVQGGNVLNNMNAGPMLEYYGVRGLAGDTRPELLTEKISGIEGLDEELSWFCSGWIMENVSRKYADLQDYMDQNDIQFVLDTANAPNMSYLCGWLSSRPEWTLHVFEDAEGTDYEDDAFPYAVWERMGFQPSGQEDIQ